MEGDKIGEFLRDAANLGENLRWSLEELKRRPSDHTLVHEAFRYVHSLKSEAEIVHEENIAAVAHEMEGVLDQIRRGTLAADDQSLPMLQSMLDELQAMLRTVGPEQDVAVPAGHEAVAQLMDRNDHDGEDRQDASVTSQHDAESADTRVPAKSSRSTLRGLSEFEHQLLREAAERGERAFRLVCEIDDSAPLKYPKAYLVVNNLEVVTNVVRNSPPFDRLEDDEAFRVVEVLLTSALSQERIREAVDVDQIKRIEIDEVSQSDVSENVSTGGSGSDVAEPVELGTAHKMWSSIRVENGRLDELSDHLAELRERVERLHAEARADVDRAEIVADADAASMLVRHIEEVAGRIRLMPIGDEFRRLHWIVRDLAATLERSVRLYTDGDEIAIDRRLPALLSEPLTHLVRNAVDHGIESVQERQASGKPIIGTIRVSASRDGSELVIRVQDDGRGITASEVADHARSAGILSADAKTPSTMDELLNLLIQPGFSTRREATRVSGRGVGLDLVSERVRHMLGGTLRLETRPGAGCTFVITVPCEASLMSVLVVRCGRRTIGIPQRNIERIADWNDADFGNDEGGAPQYDGASLVSVDNGRTDGAAVGAGGHVIVLESSGERAALAVDELLFERDVPEERITLIGQEGPYLSRAQIGGKEVDFLLLNPAAVV